VTPCSAISPRAEPDQLRSRPRNRRTCSFTSKGTPRGTKTPGFSLPTPDKRSPRLSKPKRSSTARRSRCVNWPRSGPTLRRDPAPLGRADGAGGDYRAGAGEGLRSRCSARKTAETRTAVVVGAAGVSSSVLRLGPGETCPSATTLRATSPSVTAAVNRRDNRPHQALARATSLWQDSRRGAGGGGPRNLVVLRES